MSGRKTFLLLLGILLLFAYLMVKVVNGDTTKPITHDHLCSRPPAMR